MTSVFKITVDFQNIIGKIKPVHGFNNAARKTGYGELLADFVDLHPPVIRLHDTCGFYGGAHYVDIPNVFPNFDADPENEASYDFALTDAYIQPLIEAGMQVMYRLGVTIEHAPKKYHVYPPKDPEKWANICEHVVRHYNDGWCNGHNWDIQYWEIWNEPDGLHPNIEPNGPPMWNGTAEEYYRLYTLTANKIKNAHPDVKVGGYSSCYILGAFTGERWTEGPTDYFTNFLSYISAPATKAPLDFFSYHGYLGRNYLGKIEKEYSFVKKTLHDFGFDATEIHDTEWNTNIGTYETQDKRTMYYINMRNNYGAAHAAGALYEMQRLGVDCAMFYDAQLWWEYGCLFHVPELKPTKTYYAFKQFDRMYALQNAAAVTCPQGLYACAATGGEDMLGVANVGDDDVPLTFDVPGSARTRATLYETSADYTNEPVWSGSISELTALQYTVKSNSFITLCLND